MFYFPWISSDWEFCNDHQQTRTNKRKETNWKPFCCCSVVVVVAAAVVVVVEDESEGKTSAIQ